MQALTRVVTNLLDNMAKFARKVQLADSAADGSNDSPLATAALAFPTTRSNQRCNLSFRFDPSRNRETGGTRLGLAIVAELASRSAAAFGLSTGRLAAFRPRYVVGGKCTLQNANCPQ